METTRREPSIQLCLTRNIILFVLVPLFLALAVLCGLLQYHLASGTAEAYQMMFNQNVKGIDSAILQSNYASSTMITYTDNIDLLRHYYETESEYEKFSVIAQMERMLSNCEVTALDSFRGEMMLLMNDGRSIAANKTEDISGELEQYSWWEKLQDPGLRMLWSNEISNSFPTNNQWEYVSFGRRLMRYQEEPLGYALVRIPKMNLFQFSQDPQFQVGTMALLSAEGEILSSEGGTQTDAVLEELFEHWEESQEDTGTYQGLYYMASRLDSCSNAVLYAADGDLVFARSKTIRYSAVFFMVLSAAGLVLIVIYLSRYIAGPILFFADRSRMIEQNRPELLVLKKHHYHETKILEEGMLSAQKRIALLVKEVRQETERKEKALYEALRAQIMPHFLFNTLNAIRWKASLNKDEEVADILADLGMLLGEAYQNTDEMETVDNSMKILDAYVRIMQIRFGDKVQFFFLVPDTVKEYLIPRFCLQPLVENSFIHGMSRVEEGVIALRGSLDGTDLVFTLIDNGVGLHGKKIDLNGMEEPKDRGMSGIGLSNIHRRIQLLFGKDYGLEVDDTVEVGFKISLRIPGIRETDGSEDE